MINIKYWLPVLLCMGLIFCASSLPGKDLPLYFCFQAVTFHFFAYLILAYFFMRALKGSFPGVAATAALFLTVGFAVFYGLTDELHQLFVPCRHCSGMDLFIDSLGGLAGAIVYQLIHGRDKALQGDYL